MVSSQLHVTQRVIHIDYIKLPVVLKRCTVELKENVALVRS